LNEPCCAARTWPAPSYPDRIAAHENRSKSQRIGDHARLFFNAVEPFIVDDVADHKHGRVRRLMRPRPAKEIAPGSTVDAEEVAEAESLVGFVMACHNYASELAINEITQRTFAELQQCLDIGTKTLLDALRGSGDNERAFQQSQVDAAVRFCGKVFGQEYASLLTKAADVATHGERKRA
jgi:hypothetical protein